MIDVLFEWSSELDSTLWVIEMSLHMKGIHTLYPLQLRPCKCLPLIYCVSVAFLVAHSPQMSYFLPRIGVFCGMSIGLSSIEISPNESLQAQQVLVCKLFNNKHCLQIARIIDPKLFLKHHGQLTHLGLSFYQIEQLANMRSLHPTLIQMVAQQLLRGKVIIVLLVEPDLRLAPLVEPYELLLRLDQSQIIANNVKPLKHSRQDCQWLLQLQSAHTGQPDGDIFDEHSHILLIEAQSLVGRKGDMVDLHKILLGWTHLIPIHVLNGRNSVETIYLRQLVGLPVSP